MAGSVPQPAARGRSVFAWQGWQLVLPSRWNPIRLEGDYSQGHALFMDLYGPRLGIMWRKLGKRLQPEAWAQRALREEVGRLAAEEARPLALKAPQWQASSLYSDPEPPGRDVWVGYSQQSGRALIVTYHARRRERILAETVLPTLQDLPADQPMPWSVFELSCLVPAGYSLQQQQLNVGDLSLTFAMGRQEFTVRQIAVAELALNRMPLQKWLAQQERRKHRRYRPLGEPEKVRYSAHGRDLAGLSRMMARRRRFFFMWRVPRQMLTIALHDQQRNRLVLLQSTDLSLPQQLIEAIGWASEGRAGAS